MKLMNPTPDKILSACNGISYVFAPNQAMEIDSSIGSWLLSRFGHYGLICLDLPQDVTDVNGAIVRAMLEGLSKYAETMMNCLQYYMDFDTAMKLANEHGTILTHPNVIEIQKKIEIANRMIDELQAKYGIVIRQDEIKAHTVSLLSEVEALVADAKKDVDHQKKFLARQRELDRMMNSAIDDAVKHIAPTVVSKKSDNSVRA